MAASEDDQTDAPASMLRRRAGGVLWRLADLTRADETRRSFRAKAYRSAVWALDRLSPSLGESRTEMLAVPGVGPGVAALIEEIRQTGTVTRLGRLERTYPAEAHLMRRLPRMTPSLLRALKMELGVETRADLVAAIESGAALTLAGVGERTLELWKAVIALAPHPGVIPSHRAWVSAFELAQHLRLHTGAAVEVAGSVRRVEEWVGRLELAAASDTPDDIRAFMGTSAVLAGSEQIGGDVAFTTHDGIDGVARITSPGRMGTVMIIATGPEQHAEEVLGTGPVATFATEAEAYRTAGTEWVPPAARELALERAADVVTTADLRGDLHIHSDRSPDGRMSLATICDAAVGRGYEYVLITDHTQGLRFGGLGQDELAQQASEIDRVRSSYPGLTIMHGAEVNIGPGGDLDLADETLDNLDFVVAGLHSDFHLDREAQTERLIRALSHRAVGVLAHPTGRRIGIRPGIDVDMPAVMAAAARFGVALECNGHRDRLDLQASWAERAAAAGVMFAANSDAHRVGEISNIENAVSILQRSGIGPHQVLNAGDTDALGTWLATRA